MTKKWFLQFFSLFACGTVLAAVVLNKIFHKRYLPFTLDLDNPFFLMLLVSTTIPIFSIYLLVKHDKLIVPGILKKLEELKDLICELNQYEIIYVSLFAGLSEELLFRGLLQPFWGVTITSILFGALHFLTLGYFLLATALGFYFGAIYLYSENILIPIIAHGVYNIYAFNLLRRIYHGRYLTTHST
jgi:membrane protease YdiL (CAAX protease family)